MQIDTLYVNLFFYTHLLVMELNTENCIWYIIDTINLFSYMQIAFDFLKRPASTQQAEQ